MIITHMFTWVNIIIEKGEVMAVSWTGDVVGILFAKKIQHKELAGRLDFHPKYLSAILNGKRSPANAEAKIKKALWEIIEEKEKLL